MNLIIYAHYYLVYRSERLENKLQILEEISLSDKREKIFDQVKTEMEKENSFKKHVKSKLSLNFDNIEDPDELYDTLEGYDDVEMFEVLLIVCFF